MNIVVINVNNGDEMYFVLNNKHRFSEISSLPKEVLESIALVYTTRELVEYVNTEYPSFNVVLFEAMNECFKKAGRSTEDIIICVDYGMIGYIINWLTKMIPFNMEIYRA